MSDREKFLKKITEVLKPAFAADGFRSLGTTFRRTQGEVVHVIWLQGYRHGGRCCVNLGIHLTFLPTAGTGKMCDSSKITEAECEFRTRLAPTGEADHWWNYGATENESQASVESILQIYRRVGAPYFDQFSNFPDHFLRVTPAMLTSGAPLPFPGKGTSVRRALSLARIALHIGHLSDARQFAEIGLAQIGPASLLKDDFQRILTSE